MDRDSTSGKANPVRLSRAKQLLYDQQHVSTPGSQHSSASEYSPSFIKNGQSIIATNNAVRASVSAKSEGHPRPHLPKTTEVHTVSPSAAGFPVLEVIRNLEMENILSKDDRLALKDGLYSTDVVRREEVVKALCDVELSGSSQFAVRRLKSVIHQNPTGLPSKNLAASSSEKSGGSYSAAAAYVNSNSKSRQQSSSNNNNNHDPASGSSSSAYTSPTGRKIDIKLNFSQMNAGIAASEGPNSGVPLSSERASGRLSNRNQHNHNSSPTLHSPDHPLSTRLNSNAKPPMHGNNNLLSPTQVALQQFNGRFEEEPATQIQNTINKVVGEAPMYSGPGNYNVLDKISARYHEYELQKMNTNNPTEASRLRSRKYCVIVGCGSFNPLTRMHLRTFYLAKQYIEAKLGYLNLGTLLSPAHGVTVRERFRTNTHEIIPSPHRLAVAQLLVQNSKWLSIDPWEITRRRPMDYLSLLEHVQQIMRDRFPEIEVRVFYFSKGNMIPKLSPQALRLQNFGCVCVTRAPESDTLRRELSSKWNGIISVVEDSAILDASVDVVTSRKVRDKVRAGESVAYLVGEKINDYVAFHHLGPKMNGEEEWNETEKLLPKFASRPAEPALRSQSQASSVLSSSVSMKSLGSVAGSVVSESGGGTPAAYTPSWGDSSGHASGGGGGGGGANNVRNYSQAMLQAMAEADEAAEGD